MRGNQIGLVREMRSGRFICLIAMLIFGCFSITTTCLLVRSDKNTELENILRIQGDYDEIIYETGIGFENALSTSALVADIGVYYELGTVTNENDTFSFKAAALKDALSEDIYHMTCIRGRYPKSDDEIAIDISVANTYGIAPYPGESPVFLNALLMKHSEDGKDTPILLPIVRIYMRCQQFSFLQLVSIRGVVPRKQFSSEPAQEVLTYWVMKSTDC